NSRCALFSGAEQLSLLSVVELPTLQFHTFDELLLAFRGSKLALNDVNVAVLAAAGPIANGVCHLPNVPWPVEASAVQKILQIRNTALINDFVAMSYSILTPVRDSAETILSGTAEHTAPAVILGAGTGLGKAVICHPQSEDAFALPSEGGHGDF